MNKVFLIGHVGADAELKFTQGGEGMLKFRVATTEKWKDGQGKPQERTEWHMCTMWGKRCEPLSKYIVKGRQLSVEGSLTTRQWEDKNGSKHYSTEIRVDNVEFLGGGGVGRESSGGPRGGQQHRSAAEDGHGPGAVDEDDIPFAPLGDVG